MDEKRVILVQNHPFLTVHLESWVRDSGKRETTPTQSAAVVTAPMLSGQTQAGNAGTQPAQG